MSEPIKLKNAGDKHTMDVAKCRDLPFGNDPEVEYEGRDGSKVWMPKSSSDRQLARLSLTMESIVGRRITIKRDPNSTAGRKPYWGIYLEDGETKGGAASAVTSGGATAASQDLKTPGTTPAASNGQEKPSALYEKVTDFVLDKIVPRYAAAGIPVTDRGVAAIVATVFIAARDH